MKPLPYNNATRTKKNTQQAKALKLMAICLMLFTGCSCNKQSPLKAYRYTPPPPLQETWTWTKLNCPAPGPDVVAVDPRNGNTLFVGSGRDSGGVWKSSDGGGSFIKVWDPGAFDLAIDLRNSQVIYTARMVNGVWQSKDGGNNWEQLTTYFAAFVRPDRFDSSYIYAGPWRSTDYGSTWTPSIPYLRTPSEVYGFDQSWQNLNILFAGWSMAGGGIVYKSIDRGASWTRAREGIGEISGVVVSPFTDQWVFADAGRYSADSSLKSTDGGSSWGKFSLGPGVSTAAGFTIDPRPGFWTRLYAGGNLAEVASNKGVYRSTNGGETWEQIGLQGVPVWNLAVDPTAATNTTVIYAVSDGNGVPTDGLYKGVLTKK